MTHRNRHESCTQNHSGAPLGASTTGCSPSASALGSTMCHEPSLRCLLRGASWTVVAGVHVTQRAVRHSPGTGGRWGAGAAACLELIRLARVRVAIEHVAAQAARLPRTVARRPCPVALRRCRLCGASDRRRVLRREERSPPAGGRAHGLRLRTHAVVEHTRAIHPLRPLLPRQNQSGVSGPPSGGQDALTRGARLGCRSPRTARAPPARRASSRRCG